ncbi:phosphate ABC transporter permease subunit PstC [Stomatohabitans albus]|uniref:phosphate ABC transporter permease subunit PstC n=1 Tax=Stomatohabitans albus TaxID=3110766 RepID=UPI00300D133D
MSNTLQPARAAIATDRKHLGDTIFTAMAYGSGAIILALLAGVALFLLWQAVPAITATHESLPGGKGFIHYVAPLVFGTVQSAVIAVAIALPLSIAIGLFISHYAPRRLSTFLGFIIDLLAAIPSIIFGLWGSSVLAGGVVPVQQWLHTYLGFIPFFAGNPSPSGRTMLTTGLVLAIMILPIMTATNREVFMQTPRLQEEAAIGLGATRWEMIRLAVIPFGMSGVIAGTMLGLGRALGETMAVVIILSNTGRYNWSVIETQNADTIAANIARQFPESSGLDVNVLIASGLVLFVLTLLVNTISRWIVGRMTVKG